MVQVRTLVIDVGDSSDLVNLALDVLCNTTGTAHYNSPVLCVQIAFLKAGALNGGEDRVKILFARRNARHTHIVSGNVSVHNPHGNLVATRAHVGGGLQATIGRQRPMVFCDIAHTLPVAATCGINVAGHTRVVQPGHLQLVIIFDLNHLATRGAEAKAASIQKRNN